jgi:hypothetical protein
MVTFAAIALLFLAALAAGCVLAAAALTHLARDLDNLDDADARWER